MHLQYCLLTASFDHSENRHAQVVMKDLGITYQHATPQSMTDSWIFWNCKGVPTNLPKYLSKRNFPPQEWIGYGLNQELADAISTNKGETE